MKRIDVAAIPALYRQRGIVAQTATFRSKIRVHENNAEVQKTCGCILTVLFATDEELDTNNPFDFNQVITRAMADGYSEPYINGVMNGFDGYKGYVENEDNRYDEELGGTDGNNAFNALVREGLAYVSSGVKAYVERD